LVAAGLFLRTLVNLRAVDIGFNPHDILFFRVNPYLNGYDQSRTDAICNQILEKLRSIPGVTSVTLSDRPQMGNGISSDHIYVDGHEAEHSGDNLLEMVRVGPDFFQVLGIPMIVGRAPTERDDRTAPKVAVINEAAARKYFSGNPVGQRYGYFLEGSREIEVIGVVHDAKYNSLRDQAPATEYLPLLQQPYHSSVLFELRTAREPEPVIAPVRNAVREIDPNLPITNVSTQMDDIDGLLQRERMYAIGYTLFGSLALLLTSIGLFGVMSYSVARRTNEIGIRMALGARATDVRLLVIRESLELVFTGLLIGLIVALLTNRLIAKLLFGLSSMDIPTIAAVILFMGVVAALAAYLPARWASRVDPTAALRYE